MSPPPARCAGVSSSHPDPPGPALRPGLLVLFVVCLTAWCHSSPLLAEVSRVEALLDGLSRGNEGARLQAASRLYHLGQSDRGVPRVVGSLRHENPDQRCLAARLLGMLRSVRGVAPLIGVLDDEEWAVRRDVAEALGQIGDRSAATALVARLADSHSRVRISAARALGELGVTTGLAAALAREQDPEVRLHLVEALGRNLDSAGTGALQPSLRDDVESVRLLAAGFLVEHGDVDAVGLLGSRLASGQAAVERREAAEALGRATGGAAERAREALGRALMDREATVGLAAARALVRLGDSRGRSHLSAVARGNGPPDLRARALALLDELGP